MKQFTNEIAEKVKDIIQEAIKDHNGVIDFRDDGLEYAHEILEMLEVIK